MKYKIYNENGKQVIERLAFPRFKGIIRIDDVELIDDCDPEKLASAVKSAGEYIVKGRRTSENC